MKKCLIFLVFFGLLVLSGCGDDMEEVTRVWDTITVDGHVGLVTPSSSSLSFVARRDHVPVRRATWKGSGDPWYCCSMSSQLDSPDRHADEDLRHHVEQLVHHRVEGRDPHTPPQRARVAQ